ncbi:hypothetical protein [Actinoplanes sp. NPDC049681]|uniref:hypothetical protein n=1 Tax=Actinoplanes sp. NPDC049681 TaxID=3363905 RepID=UPI0037A4D267
MQGTHDPESTGPEARTSPADWPAPDTPLPEEEPTVELPAVAADRPAGWNGPTLARAALSLVITRREPDPDPAVPSPPPEPATPSPSPAARPAAALPAEPLAPASLPADAPASASPPPVAEPGRRWLVGAGIAAAALVLAGVAVVVVGRDRHDDGRQWAPPAAAAEEDGDRAPSAPPPATGHTATGPRGGRTAAALDLIDGARTVTLRTADLGDDLYRISTPAGEQSAPRADLRDGRVRVRLDGKPDAVDVALNTRVRWDLRMAGGAQLSTIDLSGARVGGVELSGGASRINLTLPEPDGTLSVRMSGGVSLFDVRTAGSAPVRVRLGSGASQVVLDGRTHRGVAAGRTFTPPSWAGTTDRVDVDAVAGLSALTVAPTGG